MSNKALKISLGALIAATSLAVAAQSAGPNVPPNNDTGISGGRTDQNQSTFPTDRTNPGPAAKPSLPDNATGRTATPSTATEPGTRGSVQTPSGAGVSTGSGATVKSGSSATTAPTPIDTSNPATPRRDTGISGNRIDENASTFPTDRTNPGPAAKDQVGARAEERKRRANARISERNARRNTGAGASAATTSGSRAAPVGSGREKDAVEGRVSSEPPESMKNQSSRTNATGKNPVRENASDSNSSGSSNGTSGSGNGAGASGSGTGSSGTSGSGTSGSDSSSGTSGGSGSGTSGSGTSGSGS